MDTKDFLNTVCNEIKYKPICNEISEELENHIEDLKEEFIKDGMEEKKAEEKAIKNMGDAEKLGKDLNKIHRPKLDWKLLILIVILFSFGLLISVLQENNNHIVKSIVYMIIGSIMGIGIYFFDYRKIEKFSDIIYIIATIIMILPFIGFESINVIRFTDIFGIIILSPTIAVPLYIIAFVGFIQKEDLKNRALLFLRSIFSIMLIMCIPSVANVVVLSVAYVLIYTIKLFQEKNNHILKIILTYSTIAILGVILINGILLTRPYRLERIIGSFYPEIDPQGSGYTGMLQKEIMEKSKIIGEADTKIMSSDEYIITRDTDYAFIYLLGKTGTLTAGFLVIIIILTSVKLLLNAKKIKDQYGEFLIIGLSILFIVQSAASILMNINLGIKTSVNIPFVTYGGSHLLMNIISIGLILSAYRRKDININLSK